MKYEIAIHDDKTFTKQLLIHWVGVLELFNQKAISGQDVWDSIVLFYPKVKFKGYNTTKRIHRILGLLSEIEWSRDDFPHTYPKSLKQLRSLLKKEIKRLEDVSIADGMGGRKIIVSLIQCPFLACGCPLSLSSECPTTENEGSIPENRPKSDEHHDAKEANWK